MQLWFSTMASSASELNNINIIHLHEQLLLIVQQINLDNQSLVFLSLLVRFLSWSYSNILPQQCRCLLSLSQWTNMNSRARKGTSSMTHPIDHLSYYWYQFSTVKLTMIKTWQSCVTPEHCMLTIFLNSSYEACFLEKVDDVILIMKMTVRDCHNAISLIEFFIDINKYMLYGILNY